MQSTVVFLFGDNPQIDGAREVLGSGVLIGTNHPCFDPQQQFTRDTYVVTAAHVVKSGGSIIRLNTKDGGSRYIELDPAEWVISEVDDVAVVDITEMLNDDDEIVVIHDSWLADKQIIDHYQIGMGEDGLALGLFSNLPGTRRNVITGRFGNVSLMADTEAQIEYAGRLRPAHLFDMKSRPGLSGSPIFVYRTPSSDLRLVDQGPRHPTDDNEYLRTQTYWRHRENTFVKLLGIHSAQYTDSVQVMRDRELVHEVNGPIRDGDCLRIPNSMSVVVPADSVKALLSNRSLAAVREKRDVDNESYSEHVLMERTIYSGWLFNRGY
ncbi:serine protease family protein [Kozakia baliensis]|uniref:Peptidase S1 domain-containing protein n=2 Tax=Kozakia baliensis TaxID=153496 RepID=A0A1D8USP4_9PROT|nr:trypsin-like peptidase domain-containing protein [Kozakia baliensis]AOX16682.1 hypothetical protein A0U89_05565 [Kozakia baliensis]